jgi:GST-like protein
VLGPEAAKGLPNLQRHLAEISARPAAVRALALKDRHSFKTDMDEAARIAMFPHLAKKVA